MLCNTLQRTATHISGDTLDLVAAAHGIPLASLQVCHVTHMNTSCHTYIAFAHGISFACLDLCHVTHMNKSCHAYITDAHGNPFASLYVSHDSLTRTCTRHISCLPLCVSCHRYKHVMLCICCNCTLFTYICSDA